MKVLVVGGGGREHALAWALARSPSTDKVLIAQDICLKTDLVRYGGPGYGYILAHIVPRMKSRGYSDEAVDGILVDNPKRVLTFVDPRAALR